MLDIDTATGSPARPGEPDTPGWRALVEPAECFASPRDVLDCPDLDPEEKRIALISWARDELAVEAAATDAIRDLGVRSRLAFVLDALVEIDPDAAWLFAQASRELAPGWTAARRGAGPWGAGPPPHGGVPAQALA
ncbi:hypothetical protein [Salinarimonas rosea]|uniref:hypothetical protein n=1 Tax=Salinarimonas rosea TaxID=552063 RepID=UPI0004009B60|nr:hypothetical protein [Salinarimonas rosea]